MKYIVAIGDGMGDRPIETLGGKTPLQYADCKNLNRLASKGEIGLVRTIPAGVEPGTDTAFYSILGYDVVRQYTGRSPLEAAGIGIVLKDGETAFRCNLSAITGDPFEEAVLISHAGGQISSEEGAELINWLCSQSEFKKLLDQTDMTIHTGVGYRHLAVVGGQTSLKLQNQKPELAPPHDVVKEPIKKNLPFGESGETLVRLMKKSYELLPMHPINVARHEAGLSQANCIWFWGQGTKITLIPYEQKYGLKGSVISAVPVVHGIGVLAGLKCIFLPGATGELDTDYDGKADAAVSALKKGNNYVLVHVEAPDECSHMGNVEEKIEAIQRFDHMVGRLLNGLDSLKEDYRLLIMPDHYTLLSTRTHSNEPVPFCLVDSRKDLNRKVSFNEVDAENSGLFLEDARNLMQLLLELPLKKNF